MQSEEKKVSEEIDDDRRRFLGAAAVTVAAARLGVIGSVGAQSSEVNPGRATPARPGRPASFGRLKQVDAGLLNVGYAEDGSADGPVVLLLHGWAYDIHSFVEVSPVLASAGYRVIVPYLRGYGTTRFLSDDTVRNGQASVIALDVIALMDALEISRGALAGALQGHGVRQRLSHRQPGRGQGAAAAAGRAPMGRRRVEV
jgi:alpha/beta hydrolase family protein